MKGLLRKLMAFGIVAGSASAITAQNTLQFSLGDETWTYNVDTIFHAKVGPGTTQTHLELTGSSHLQVFYLTVDKTTPGVSMRAVCATDKVAGTERTSTMASRKTTNGVHYFAGTNGDFYSTSGTATNGTSKVGSPTTGCTVDREIYKTSNGNYQFSVDVDGVARVSRLYYYTGTATIDDKVTLFKGVNVSVPNNGITIFTPRYWGSTNQGTYTGSSYECTAKLVEGDEFLAGGKFRLEITSTPDTICDLAIPSDGYVIHARGNSTTGCNTGAKNFVKALKVGDIVEFENIILKDQNSTERIYPAQIVSGNPKNIGAGEILNSESERTDASALHPRTGIGVSQTGDSIIMMVVDGRSQISAGVRTAQLAGIMKYAGAYEAVNLDGGGSSTLYTEALGVRNVGSDGNERAVGNAIFAVLEAPEDTEIAEIRFADWAMVFPKYGIYSPIIYGYNKHGLMVNNNVQGFTLSCPSALGEITNEGVTLFGNGDGTHALTATYNGLTAQLPVTISTANSAEFKYTDVLLDNYREWPVEVQALVRGNYMPLNAAALSWSSGDSNIAQVDASTGIVKGVSDGTTTITGSVGDFSGAINLTVECPKAHTMPIENVVDTAAWNASMTATGLKDYKVMPLEGEGMTLNYTLASGRSRNITLTRSDLKVWSLPDSIKIVINPGTAKISTLKITGKANNGVAKDYIISSVPQNTESEYNIPVSAFGDVNDIGIYPISFSGINIVLSGGTTGTAHSIVFSKIEAVYNNEVSGIEDIIADGGESQVVTVADGTISASGVADLIEIYNLAGQKIAEAKNAPAIAAPAAGSYIIKVTTNGVAKSQKVIL